MENKGKKKNKFLHSKVNLLGQHIIVQDQDGQNNKILCSIMNTTSPPASLHYGEAKKHLFAGHRDDFRTTVLTSSGIYLLVIERILWL